MYQKGETTGSNKANRRLAEGAWEMIAQRSAEEQELLFDPQTSGGLLIAVPDSQADDLISRLKKEGLETAVRVGEVVDAERPHIRVV
jgi:selenide,water dikinase